MKTFGNTELLKLHKVGYFASSKIDTLSVLPTLDWAAEIAKREDIAVISGFHSKMEREVLDYLLRGRCGIIVVLAVPIYKIIPSKFKQAFSNNRILFISEITNPSVRMVDINSARKRNQLIANMADELIFSSLTPDSSLFSIYQQASKPKSIL